MKTIIKPLLSLLILILFFHSNLNAQTFIYNPYYTQQQPNNLNDTLNVGPVSFGVTSDHRVFALVKVNSELRTDFIQYDSLGNELMDTMVIYPATLSFGSTTKLYVANNDDCVFAANRIYSDYEVSIAQRYNSNGTRIWSKNYNPNYSIGIYTTIFNIKPTWQNTTLIQFSDSLDEVDSVGNLIQRRYQFTGDFVSIPGNELIVFDSGQIIRQTFSGIPTWTLAGYGKPIYADSSYFYVSITDSIIKYRIDNGSIVWRRYMPHNDVSVNRSGELIKCSAVNGTLSNEICKYDSAGLLIWCRTINFPKYGFTKVVECTPNCIFTGGATANFDHNNTFLMEYINAFVCSLDSSGHGVIDSTTHFISGNANDNNLLGFFDDATLVAAGIGNTGPARCAEMQNSQIPYNSYFRAVFATDWSTQFGNGINHKYSDVNGDGIIDYQDLLTFATLSPPTSNSISHWRKSSNFTGIANFRLMIEQDSIIAGDSVTVDVILGNANTSIDSIYSIAFSFQSEHLFQNRGDKVYVPISDFGTPSLDLDSMSIIPFMTDFASLLLFKTNHQNASILYDTIATFRIPTPSSYTSKYYSLNCIAAAVTKEGFPVTLNIQTDSVYYFDPALVIESPLQYEFTLYPNPTTGQFYISNEKLLKLQIKVFDSTGRIIIQEISTDETISMDLSPFAMGLYTMQIISNTGSHTETIELVK